MFEVCNDIYFIVYNLYYVGQNNNLETHVGPINQDGGSIKIVSEWTGAATRANTI
jgi:hypothetical protein